MAAAAVLAAIVVAAVRSIFTWKSGPTCFVFRRLPELPGRLSVVSPFLVSHRNLIGLRQTSPLLRIVKLHLIQCLLLLQVALVVAAEAVVAVAAAALRVA